MTIQRYCSDYFNGPATLWNYKTHTLKENIVAIAKIVSYLFVITVVFVAATYGICALINRCQKNSELSPEHPLRALYFSTPLEALPTVEGPKEIEAKIEASLATPFEISSATIEKIKELMPVLIRGGSHEDIECLQKGDNSYIFKLRGTDSPSKVFKIYSPSDPESSSKTQARFKNMETAAAVKKAHNLGLLIIPNAIMFNVKIDGSDAPKSYTFIAEEDLKFNGNESAQEALYLKQEAFSDETVRQLTTFIVKTGFNDVSWRNIPTTEVDEKFLHQIAYMIDVESMKDPIEGLLGSLRNGSRGLIGCVSEKQIKIVIDTARKLGLVFPEEDTLHKITDRIEEFQNNRELAAFYKEKGILTGKEEIDVESALKDLRESGLDLSQKATRFEGLWQSPDALERAKAFREERNGKSTIVDISNLETTTFGDIARTLINDINNLIKNSNDMGSIKGKRSLWLSNNINTLAHFELVGYDHAKPDSTIWIYQIINHLVKTRHLYKLNKQQALAYFIQA